MSLLENLSQKSLYSEESLLRSREGYAPVTAELTAEQAYAHWTRRLTMLSELGSARELASLSEPALAALAAVFAQAARRRRSDKLRYAMPAGIALLIAGVLTLLLDFSLSSFDGLAVSANRTLSLACLGSGLLAVGIGALSGFSLMHLEVAHGRLGLCAGLLDEQHPWLYKVPVVMRDAAAEAYRQRVLSERGPLRGVDYLMMREIARASESLEATRVARNVAEQVQRHGPAGSAAPAKEPRLVSVAPAEASAVPERGIADAVQAGSVRVFGAAASDKRRPA